MKKHFLTYLLIAIFAISAVFTACKPDDDENGNEKVQLVKTITYYNSDGVSAYLNFEYDKKNRFATISFKYDYETIYSLRYQFEYISNDLVSLFIPDNAPAYNVVFSKNGNKIIVDFGDVWVDTCELNIDGYPIKALGINFQYLDGNIIEEDRYLETITYKYDNKKSPFYYCKTPKWMYVYIDDGLFPMMGGFSNNAINRKYIYILNDGDTIVETFTFTYEYDANGFPTKMYWDGKLYATFTY